MKTMILFIILNVPSGSNVITQEFTSQKACNEARQKLVNVSREVDDFEFAFCAVK